MSAAVAPGSENALLHSTVMGLSPLSVTTGAVASLTVTVCWHEAELPAVSVAVQVMVVVPFG